MVFDVHQHELATDTCVPLHPEPPSHYPPHPIPLSQSTSFGCSASCVKFALAIYFTYGSVHVSMLFSLTEKS